jgi:hypothetical protein
VEVGYATVGHGGVHRLMETQDVVSLAMLPPNHSALLDGPVSVVLASRNPNGRNHVSPIRLGRDDAYLYLTAGHGQVLDRNLRARPDVSFLMVDPADPYRWMSVSARAEPVVNDGDGSDACGGLIDQLGLPSAGTARSAVDGDSHGINTLYRARPGRLTLFEKSRPGL